MKRLTTILLLLFSAFSQLQAQDIGQWIDAKKPLLFEKLYLQVDREWYAPGDPIWLKAYQVNGMTHELNSNFRNIFVQLVSEQGTVVKDLLLLSIGGQASGELQTQGLENGIYTIRAFTKYLENFGEHTFYHKRIGIVNSLNSLPMAPTESLPPTMDVTFLAEGGHLVLHAVNRMAFKAIDQNGKGIHVTGHILNDEGDTITAFASRYMGMGKLSIMPQAGVNYHAVIDQYPGMKFSLPKTSSGDVCLNYKMETKALVFEISANMNLQNLPAFYFLASHKGAVLFHEKIALADYSQSVKVAKNLFPKGISKITLLDLALNPMAERLVFVDDEQDELIALHLNQPIFSPREEVKLEVDALLEPGDSINSTLSVTVVNKNYLSSGEGGQNIKSYLLLDSDLKGAIESPASYFVNDPGISSAEKLDLLMLVQGWRSYVWEDVAKIPTPSADHWNDAGINISGYVKRLLWKAPAADTEVSMDYVFRNFNIGKTTTDKDGRFLFSHTYLVDTLDVMINAKTKNGTRKAEIILDSIPDRNADVSPLLLNQVSFKPEINAQFNRFDSFRQMKEMEFNPEKGRILLDGIDIIENKTSAFARSLGEYPWADRTLMVKPEDYSYTYLIDYIVANVPSLVISDSELMMANRPMNFTLDGMDTDLREILTVGMDEIEMIDILHPGFRMAFGMKALGMVEDAGLIAIYRKDLHKISINYMDRKGRIMPDVKGFHRPASFYSPKYTLENIGSPAPDFRPTLYWNPDVRVENGKASLGFFTADVVADYVVYMEGITKNGKICFGTASFKVDK